MIPWLMAPTSIPRSGNSWASGARPAQVDVELVQGNTQLARGTVLVPGSGTGSITFPLADLTGVIEARLQVPATDGLALDDVAYAGSRAVAVVTDDAHGPWSVTRADVKRFADDQGCAVLR